MRARATTIALATLVVMVCSSRAIADTEARKRTYIRTSGDNEYVFVMIAPLALEDELRWSDSAAGVREVRRRHRQSGLYRTDGSGTPLWTVDWYAHAVHVFSDGIHLVRAGPWPTSTSQEALSFFAKGALLKTYTIRQLVDVPWILPHTVSHFQWQRAAELDDAALKYTVNTLDGSRFTFDVRNGEILSRHRPVRWVAILVLGLIGLTGGFRLLRRRKIGTGRPNKPLQPTSGGQAGVE